MPELPEVETVCRGLARVLPGRTIAAVALARGDVVRAGAAGFAAALTGRTFGPVRRRGKNILIAVGSDLTLRVNLGMTGRLFVCPAATPAAKHTHLRVTLAGDNAAPELRFVDPRRFGGLWLLQTARLAVAEGLAELGPEPLEIGSAEFAARLRRDRPVKSALLDQHMLAGVGNIYADEALFAAGIHPKARCRTLAAPRVRRLHAAIQRVLRAAIACGGSTIRDYVSADGEEGWFQLRHKVYGRDGEPCRRCRTPVRRIVITGRSSHFCPKCQPLRQGKQRGRSTTEVFMLLVEFSISPLGKGESVGKFVARSLEVIDKSGLDYELHAMGTIVEGEWDQIMAVVKRCFDAVRRDCPRVTMSLKADWRAGRSGALRAKVSSVEKRLGRRLRTGK